MVQDLYSCGKLLITGEYLILRGARGLALPTSYGQHMRITSTKDERIEWKSYDREGKLWFQALFSIGLDANSVSDSIMASRLQSILKEIRMMKPDFFEAQGGVTIETRLEFARDWGLGSSSTLIHNLAQWTGVDALELSKGTLGGSGYDVATAMCACPIGYTLINGKASIEKLHYNPGFKDKLWFVHLGKKEDSAKAVKAFDQIRTTEDEIETISKLTENLVSSNELSEFQTIIHSHEELMEDILQQPSASSKYSDYTGGVVKYLGAWGGDFMLVTGEESDLEYFRVKGLDTIVSFEQMIASR